MQLTQKPRIRFLGIYNTARELNNKLPVIVRQRHVEDGAVFPSEDEHLHIICEDLLTSLALASETLRRIMAEPVVREEEEPEEEMKPAERLRQLFEAEYRRSVDSVRGTSNAMPETAQEMHVPKVSPATPAASAEALGKALADASAKREAALAGTAASGASVRLSAAGKRVSDLWSRVKGLIKRN